MIFAYITFYKNINFSMNFLSLFSQAPCLLSNSFKIRIKPREIALGNRKILQRGIDFKLFPMNINNYPILFS